MGNSTLRRDILNEIFNVSVGKAASMLSEIVNRKIILNVPNIEFLDAEAKDFRLEDHLPKILNGTLMVSSISFLENLSGIANLIFPADKMRTFINLCMNQPEDAIPNDTDFTDIDFDIIKEIGNIILNCIIGELGNYLSITLDYTLPKVKVYQKINFSNDIEKSYKSVLLLYITFLIDDTEIQGAILVDLTLKSLNHLLKMLDEIEDGLNG